MSSPNHNYKCDETGCQGRGIIRLRIQCDILPIDGIYCKEHADEKINESLGVCCRIITHKGVKDA